MPMENIVVCGGAGFIGSQLVKRELLRKKRILVLDNLCRGRSEFLEGLPNQELLTFVNCDLSSKPETVRAISEFNQRFPVSIVWHLAANSDIPSGIADPGIDLRDTFLTTFNILAAMRECLLGKLAFASSSAIYGNHGRGKPLREDMGPLLPISNYGAMKLASEGLISAAAESFLQKAWIFRFPNVVGVPATHGVIVDFVRRLKENPARLDVLGNGTQRKLYIHVGELIDAMEYIIAHSPEKVAVYNIGPDDDGISVREIAEKATRRVSPGAAIAYGVEDRGWVGDVPAFSYNVDKLKNLGFAAKGSSHLAIDQAVEEIASQEGC